MAVIARPQRRSMEFRLTHRWSELDSNFPYAGAMNLVFAPFVSLDDRQLSKDHDGVARAVGFITDQTVNGKMPAGRPKIGYRNMAEITALYQLLIRRCRLTNSHQLPASYNDGTWPRCDSAPQDLGPLGSASGG